MDSSERPAGNCIHFVGMHFVVFNFLNAEIYTLAFAFVFQTPALTIILHPSSYVFVALPVSLLLLFICWHQNFCLIVTHGLKNQYSFAYCKLFSYAEHLNLPALVLGTSSSILVLI